MHLENHSQIREDHEEALVDFERLPGPWKSHLDIQECLDCIILSAYITGTLEVREAQRWPHGDLMERVS